MTPSDSFSLLRDISIFQVENEEEEVPDPVSMSMSVTGGGKGRKRGERGSLILRHGNEGLTRLLWVIKRGEEEFDGQSKEEEIPCSSSTSSSLLTDSSSFTLCIELRELILPLFYIFFFFSFPFLCPLRRIICKMTRKRKNFCLSLTFRCIEEGDKFPSTSFLPSFSLSLSDQKRKKRKKKSSFPT